jgi:hypothetical protein
MRTGPKEDAFAIRKSVRDQWETFFVLACQEVFDKVAGGEGTIHIPRLDIKLSVGSEKELAELLPGLIRQQLIEQLKAALRKPDRSENSRITSQKAREQHSRFDVLLQYLTTGIVPWQTTSATASEVAATLTEICHQEWLQLMDYLHNEHVVASFYFRLFQLISKEQYIALIRLLSKSIPLRLRTTVMQCVMSLFDSDNTQFSRYTHLQLAAKFLSESLRRHENNIVPTLFSITEEVVPIEERHAFYDFIFSLPDISDAWIGQKWPDGDTEEASEFSNLLNDKQEWKKTDAHASTLRKEDVTPSFPDATKDKLRNMPSGDMFPLVVHQAGLILLHPFITRFFEKAGIIQKEKAQLPPFALPRAAALLHFLATGHEEVYEYELGLIKIMLGLQPETQLPVCRGFIQAGDKEEAEELLQSVIEHWTALKNTSFYGLRSSFLQRQALLREEENGWKLNVEQEPFDMLLDQLPWSFSIVKLPWMRKAIYTEW